MTADFGLRIADGGNPQSAIRWRVVVEAPPSGGRSGAENMAADEALLRDAHRTGQGSVRIYAWSPPCLSFGKHEPIQDRYDVSAIERLGIATVRRPTGGRAVWHEHEVTYAVAAPVAWFGSLRAAYRVIHERLACILRSLGAEATLAPDGAAARPSGGPTACFATAAGGEILVGSRKLVGSAQVRLGSALLQHGSILLDGSQDMVRVVSREPSPAGRETTLAAALGRPVSFEEVARAIAAEWNVRIGPGANRTARES